MSIVRALARMGLVATIKARAEKSLHRLAFSVAMGGFAVLLFLVALVFLAYAAFLALAVDFGPIGAALMVSGGTVLLAILVMWIGIPGARPGFLRPRPKKSTIGTSSSTMVAATAFATGFLSGRSRQKGD